MRSQPVPVLVLWVLLASGCGREAEPSLREALDALPRDTAAAPVPTPVEVDTTGAPALDTLPAAPDSGGVDGDSGSVPWRLPIPQPNDTRPWIPENPGRAVVSESAPGEWTSGVAAAQRPRSPMVVQTGIRTARHPEYDRVVLELSGEGSPGYHVEYVDRPVRQCGSGEVVPVAGDGWLRVRLEPAQAHDDGGRATIARERRAFRPSLDNVLELRLVCDFEGQVEWVIGVRSPNQYRVLELSSPARVVIDIQN